jgi:hypothetical protein
MEEIIYIWDLGHTKSEGFQARADELSQFINERIRADASSSWNGLGRYMPTSGEMWVYTRIENNVFAGWGQASTKEDCIKIARRFGDDDAPIKDCGVIRKFQELFT